MESIDAFITIAVLHRLNECHDRDVNDIRFTKYTRKYLIDVYDGLWQKTGFEDQTVGWYPERSIPMTMQHRRPPKVNVNDDPDLSIGEKSLSDNEDDQPDGQGRQTPLEDHDADDDLDLS